MSSRAPAKVTMRDFFVLCTMIFETFRVELFRICINFWVKMDLVDEIGGVRSRWYDLCSFSVGS